jgi:O-antigen ligase/Tfp pilus assembly protein PilF
VAGTVVAPRLSRGLEVLGDLLDWAVLGGTLALLGWTAQQGLTFIPSAGYRAHLVPLLRFEQAAVGLGALATVRRLLGGRALPAGPLSVLAAACVVAALSLVHTTDLYATREMVYLVLALSVLALAVLGALNDALKTRVSLAGLAALAVGEAGVALGQYAAGLRTPSYWLGAAFAAVIRTRVYGTLSSPNVLAGFLLLGTAASAILGMTHRGVPRLVSFGAVVVQVWALALTYSRGGYAGLATFLLVAAAVLWPERRRAWPVLAVAVLVAGAAVARLPAVGLRASSLGPAQEDTVASRLFIWQTALRVWRAHRIWGTGLGTFNAAYAPARPAGVHATYAMLAVPGSAHNDYLQLLAETGLVGAALLGAVLVGTGARAAARYTRAPPEARIWIGTGGAALLGLGVMSLVDENLYVVANLAFLLVAASTAAAHVSLPERSPLRAWQRLLILPLVPLLVWLPPVLPVPVLAHALHDRATREVKEGRYVQAVRTFEEALRADPLDPVVPAYFGDLLADLFIRRLDNPMGPWPTMPARAAELYRLAMRLDPYNAYPHAELGRLLLRLEHRPREAVASLWEAVRLDPYTPRYRLWLGEALAETGDTRGAVAQLEEAVRLFPLELVVIEHHEGQSPRYRAEQGLLARAQAELAGLRGASR